MGVCGIFKMAARGACSLCPHPPGAGPVLEERLSSCLDSPAMQVSKVTGLAGCQDLKPLPGPLGLSFLSLKGFLEAQRLKD